MVQGFSFLPLIVAQIAAPPAFTFSLEWVKHVTTITVAVLTLTGLFVKDFQRLQETKWLLFCWVTLICSLASGMFFLGTLVAQLNAIAILPTTNTDTLKDASSLAKSTPSIVLDVYAFPGILFAFVENTLFVIGLFFFFRFVRANLTKRAVRQVIRVIVSHRNQLRRKRQYQQSFWLINGFDCILNCLRWCCCGADPHAA